jgi:hypothetical protein
MQYMCEMRNTDQVTMYRWEVIFKIDHKGIRWEFGGRRGVMGTW